MSARKTVVTIHVEHGSRSAWFYGPTRLIHPEIRAAGSPYQWDTARRATSVPIGKAAEIEARIEANGNRVQYQAGVR